MATPSFHEGVAARTERLEGVGAMVRLYITVHMAEEGRGEHERSFRRRMARGYDDGGAR
ncbi:hypothetical protein [Streptomyces sp. GQFP]|uniref:hypothetical protein n=1 Tax=Streptomyces sp. GQFP TaxID=2907545 RepID=UPI001F419CC2|nr:hypothetical protein [Streptomyces sp. GQFP]UIX33131.1 hypothetical protein LUX31_25685 [Streptomyces sp. GQFP]